ncbi:MAG: rhomboid family intramembrane serine protease [bacterium]
MRGFSTQGGFSGRRAGFGPGLLPPFIKVMLAANVGVFILQLFTQGLIDTLGLTPARFFAEFPNLLYQLVSYMFLHGSFGHIFFNMFALWMFGTEIERTWGSKSFGRFYFLAGIAGAVLTLIAKPAQPYPMIGASAAIYGILTAYWVMFPNRMLYIYFLFPVKVKWAVPGMMLLGFLFGGSSVAHFAHLGGAVFGLIWLKMDWRWLAIGSWLKRLRYKRQTAKLNKNRQKAEDVMKRVDAILDRINEVGLENLSREERKFLEEASSELTDRKAQD